MSKKKNLGAEEVVNAANEAVPSEEPTLPVDVSFDDAQLARVLEAGLEPAQVRNEFGLVLIKNEPAITLTEAIERAKAKYLKPAV